MVLLSLIFALFSGMFLSMYPTSHRVASGASKLSFLSLLTGKYLSPQSTEVDFQWEEPQPVGNNVCFLIRFFQRNGQPYPICDGDNLLVEIMQDSCKIACSVELGGVNADDVNKAKVQFSVRRSGEYVISILLNMIHIRGSPFIKNFVPGPPDPQKSGFIHHCSTVVCTENMVSQLFFETRDEYGNLCDMAQNSVNDSDYQVVVLDEIHFRGIENAHSWQNFHAIHRRALMLKLAKKGFYHAIVSYKGKKVKNGDFSIVVLTDEEAQAVQKRISKKTCDYPCKLLSVNGERVDPPSNGHCYITPKQITVKERRWHVFLQERISFRVCPSTKFTVSPDPYTTDICLEIVDGCQKRARLSSKEAHVIVAVFSQFLLRNIGGSETFTDKQDFFHHEVRKHHQKHFHDKLEIKIDRKNILQSSMDATRYFSEADWCKNFEIHFIEEEGLDWGGLRREWFDLLCSALFSPNNTLFRSFRSDGQGLVHPSHSYMRSPQYKPKLYEFAGKIVGKCLYESSLGSSYRQLVKAKFTRSFLAQIIGLSVHYGYFEQDDPELYMTKVQYILNNDVSNMELTFTDEIYGKNGIKLTDVDLVPNGRNIVVNNRNKKDYLNALAQYRLATSVLTEIEAFMKGLRVLIPDHKLCIFDENELELLMCGTGTYSIADFKANHSISGSSYEFRKVLDWFWTAVSNFTEEEKARLLQFTTGCSQLPPGGFGELNPKFQITAVPTFGDLPTAHTCFNQLCLPEYNSYEQFDKALRYAITEGSEGFGMI